MADRAVVTTRSDRVLGWLAPLLLAVALVALLRGRNQWGAMPGALWLHLATILPALALTPVMLNGRKGDTRHRTLGYVWVALLGITAIATLFLTMVTPGHYSPIHLLSAFVLVMLVLLVAAARSHRVAQHRRRVRGLVIGALLTAGLFTFFPGRLMADWLFA